MSNPLKTLTLPNNEMYYLAPEWENIEGKPKVATLNGDGSLAVSKLILGPDSFGTRLPESGVKGQLFILVPSERISLLSSEGYILRDSNGLYLTTKESE